MTADHHRIDGLVGVAPAALALDLCPNWQAAAMRAVADAHLTPGKSRRKQADVSADDGLDAIAVEDAVPNHCGGAAPTLLGRLKDNDGGAGEILPLLRQEPGNPQADGGMGIVAAGVHLSGVEGDEVMGVLFLNWQGVDIHPDGNGRAGLAAPDDCHHTRAADPGLGLYTPIGEFFQDVICCFLDVKADAGVLVKPAPPLHQLPLKGLR